MIRVSVAVSSGADRFKADVRAESIEDAVRSAAAIYPDGEVRVLFPIDPKVFFVEEYAAVLGTVLTEAREISVGEFDEDDIVRLEDVYSRVEV